MDVQKLTKEQAVIISGFTGILCGEFSDFHADVEKRLGRGVQTFEFGFKEFSAEVKKLYEADFIEIATVCNQEERAKAQAVPEGFAVVPIEITPKQIEAYMKGKVFPASMGEHRKFVERLSKDYTAMIEAQEPAND